MTAPVDDPDAIGSWTFQKLSKRQAEDSGQPRIRITIAAADMAEARATWARFLRMTGETDQDARPDRKIR